MITSVIQAVFYVNCLFPPRMCNCWIEHTNFRSSVLTSSHIFFINNRLPLITRDTGILWMWYDILHPGCSNFHEPPFTVFSVQQTVPIRRPNNSLHAYFICTNKQKAIKINWKLVKPWTTGWASILHTCLHIRLFTNHHLTNLPCSLIVLSVLSNFSINVQ